MSTAPVQVHRLAPAMANAATSLGYYTPTAADPLSSKPAQALLMGLRLEGAPLPPIRPLP